MIQSNAKTRSDFELSENGMKLRLAIPAAPYRMPHKDGGFIMLVGYDDVGGCNTCETAPEPSCGCTPAANSCGGGCSKPATATCGPNCCNAPKDNCAKPSCGKPEPTPTTAIKRYEIVEYSGFEDDGVTAILTARGVDGTMVQSWCAGTIAVQTFTGADYNKLLTTLEEINESFAIFEKASSEKISALESALEKSTTALGEAISNLEEATTCEEVPYYFGTDNGDENIENEQTFNFSKHREVKKGGMVSNGYAHTIPKDMLYKLTLRAKAAHEPSRDPVDTGVNVMLYRGDSEGDVLFGESFKFGNGSTGVGGQDDGDDSVGSRSRILELKKDDVIIVKTTEGKPWGGHLKQASDFMIEGLVYKAPKCAFEA